MSEIFRQEIDLNDYVNEIADKLQHRVNQEALDKAAGTLAEYGYVKVVRCRDCKRFHMNVNGLDCPRLDPDGFCAWAERKVDE